MLIFKLVRQHVTMEEPSSYNGDPISMALLAGGTSLASGVAQNSALRSQQDDAAASARLNYNIEAQKQQDIRQEAGIALTQEGIKRAEERGRIRAAQAETGVSGTSSIREYANTYLKASMTKGSLISKEEAMLYSSGLQQQQTYLQTANTINQLQSQKSSPLGLVAKAAISGVGGYMAAGGTFGGGIDAANAAVANASASGVTSSTALQAAYEAGLKGWGSSTLGFALLTGANTNY